MVRFSTQFTYESGATPTSPPTSAPTSASPTPTVSTPPVSTPPTSPGPSPVKACTDPSFTTTSTDNNGDGRTFADHDGSGEYFVHNNMWNNHTGAGPTGTYTMRVCDYDNWTEDVTQRPSTVSPGAVRAYPNVHRDYNDAPLSSIQRVRFAASDPECAGCIYNVAFDAWLDDGFSHELMIWTRNWGQRPGNQLGTETIDGRQWQVWRSGSGDGGIMTYVAVVPEKFGSINFQAFVNNTRAHGWQVETTWQVDYGVETVDLDSSTNPGASQRFHFTDFQIFETGEAAALALEQPRTLTADQVKAKKAFKAKYDHRYR